MRVVIDTNVLVAGLVAEGAILTGDQDLLVLKEYEGARIHSPRQFVEWLDRQK